MKAILIFIIWVIGVYVADLNQEPDQKHNFILGFISWICIVIVPVTYFL